MDTESHEYPVTPDNGTDEGLESFVVDFERSLIYTEFHDGTEDEFYVTVSDISVSSRGNGSVVRVSTVHMVEVTHGTPADRWYAVTYVVDGSGVRRSLGTRNAPPPPGDGEYVVTCDG